MEQMDWNLARAFCATAESGSLSAAARKLGLTQPTLSRQVAALEAEIGATLFDRVGKKLILTDTGAGLLPHAQAMALAADAMAMAAAGQSRDLAGRVSISASDAFSAYLLPRIVAQIRQTAPEITLVIQASNAISDLRRREADIAIRHVRPTEPELMAQLVCEMPAHFYASAGWVARHGLPRTLEELARTELLGGDPIERYCAYLAEAGLPVAQDRFRILSENSVVLWEMVRQDMGACVMVDQIAALTPGLVRILPEIAVVSVPVWLVAHGELRTSGRIRLVFDTLAELLRSPPAQ